MTEALSDDCAWVTVPTPFGSDELRSWIADLETLFRVNSLLEITDWQQEDRRVRLRGRNLSNGRPLDLDFELKPTDGGLLISYIQGLKRSTAFVAEPGEGPGFQLRITDDYSGWTEDERQARLDEVDRSLPQWGKDLYRYFQRWRRWSWLPLWRWYTTRIWLRMKPVARRVTRWVLWITFAEIVAFLLVFTIFVVEQN